MNFAYFIARRLIKEKTFSKSISAPIIRIAIIAIALGMVMMLISIATGVGLQRKIREKITLFNGHIEISNYDNNSSQVSLNPISTEQDFYPNFTNVPEVIHIQGVASKAGIIRTETNFEGVVVKGVGADYDWTPFKEYIIEGTLPNFAEDKISREILISEYIANRLRLSVGDKIVTYFLKNEIKYNIRSFSLVGIYNSGFEQFDKSIVYSDIRHIQKMNKWKENEVGSFELFVDDFSNLNAINEKVYVTIPSTLDSNTVSQKFPGLFQWIKMFDFNIIGIIGIMVIVAIINMITAILVLILERTQLIGMLKALGAPNKTIRKIFLYNASYIILKGLFWGNLIGIGLIGLQYFFDLVKLDPANYYVKSAPVFITLPQIVLLNVGTLIVCVLVLWIPSIIISKIAPIKAIKFN